MKKLGLVLLCLVVCASLASAAGDGLVVHNVYTLPDGQGLLPRDHAGSRGGSCEMGLALGGAAYYFGMDMDEGVKLWVDPAIDQTAGECTVPYNPLLVTDVGIYFAFIGDSASYVGQTVCIDIEIECPKNLGTTYPNQCNGPDEDQILCMETFCWTVSEEEAGVGEAYKVFVLSEPCCVNGPFFFGFFYRSWTNPDVYAPQVLGDQVGIPNEECRVWSYWWSTFDGITYWPPCGWSDVATSYTTPWGPWWMWVNVVSEAQCMVEECAPCEHLYPGDDVSQPIIITSSSWQQTIDLCDYCTDYDMRDVGGAFTAQGEDVVLEIAFAEDSPPEPCFSILLEPMCPGDEFFRIRSWIADQYGTFYLGTPSNPTVGQSQTYYFIPGQLECLWNYPGGVVFHLYIDTRGCCCPVRVTYTGDTPLPVELKSFEAVSGDRMVTLNWTTATELNNNYFELQRSTAASGWTMVGKVDGVGTSVTEHSYSYVDHAVVNGVAYTYRLLSHDINGEVHEYASTVEATPGAPMPTEYALSQNFPNPFNPNTTISYSVKAAGFVSLKVYNLIGQEVATLVAGEMPAGSYRASFTATDLPSGVYVYRLEVNNFTAQKKMVLLK